jgi:hypothetical protein
MLSESNLKGEEMCDSWRRTTHPALGYLQQRAESDAKRNESGGAHMVDEESSNASKREDIGLRVRDIFAWLAAFAHAAGPSSSPHADIACRRDHG